MLRLRFFNRVVSDEGFSAKVRAFSGFVEYREGDHVAMVPVYPVIGQPVVPMYETTPIRRKEPYSAEPVDEDRRQQILQRVAQVLTFRKCKIEVLRPS